MDLTFSTDERAFEQEVRDFISSSLTPEMKRATKEVQPNTPIK